MSDLPAPLVPAHVDLSTFPAFLLDVDRVLSSESYALATPEEGWAMFNLWMRAWKQSPPASLPDDERLLAKFSGVPSKWAKVRSVAMRGFVKCSDGRLYHRYLSQMANEQWERSKAYKKRSIEANEAKARKREERLKAAEQDTYKEPTRNLQGDREGFLERPNRTEPNRTELGITQIPSPESPPLWGGGLSPEQGSNKPPREAKRESPRVVWPKLGEEPA